MTLPSHYPHPLATIVELLDWAHMAEPPYDTVRIAVPWLKSDGEVRAYLEGVARGNVFRWRSGPLFEQEPGA